MNGDTEARQPLETAKLTLAMISVGLSALIYVVVMIAAPGFQELFAGFGADLPAITQVLFAVYRWAMILLLLGLVPAVILFVNRDDAPGNAGLLFGFVIASFVISCVWFLFSIAAAYAPIFVMGSVV